MIKFLLKIYNWFFPNSCLFCGEPLPQKIYACKVCMPDYLLERNFNIKSTRQKFFLKVLSLGIYEKEIQKNIKSLKFRGCYSYSNKFMAIIYPLLAEYNISMYDAICYVPMTKNHERERGYNQTKILAKSLSKLSKIPVKGYLKKIRNNKTQHTLDAKERLKNIKNVYACDEDLRGKNILLIDDIVTTGATLSECTKTLYMKGASNVLGITVACAQFEPK